jgi:hypothetical protein
MKNDKDFTYFWGNNISAILRNINKPGVKNILLLMANMLFLLLFLMLAYYNRFAVDDYYHINDEHFWGIWGGMLEGYFKWGGRWTSYLLWDIVYHFHSSGIVLILYSSSIIFLFMLAIFLLLQRIFELFSISVSRFQIFNFSILFSAFSFFISFNKGEIWFWMQSTAMFMLSIISFIFGMSIIIGKNKNIVQYFFLIICFVYAGGAIESYAIFYIIILLLLIGGFYISPSNELIKKIKESAFGKVITALVFLAISFIISYTAPGNAIRATWLPEPSFLNSFYITLKSLVKLILFKVSPQIPWILLFSIPVMYLGFTKGDPLKAEQTKKKFRNYLGRFFLSGILLVVLIYVMLFPACYVLSEIGPDRSMSLIILVIAFFCAAWAFFIGYKCVINKKYISIVNIFSLITIIISVAIINIRQYNIVSKYASALDQRTEYLLDLQQKKNKKTIALKPLPSSGFLYSAEISEDTTYFGNDHYKRGLFLDFKVKKGINN